MRASVYVNIFPKDADRINVGQPLKTTGEMVLRLDEYDIQVFISTREQAEALFDAASEIALSFRERFPEVVEGEVKADAVIAPIEVVPIEVYGKSGVIGYRLPDRGEAMFPTREDAIAFSKSSKEVI